MNIGTGAARRRAGKALLSARHAASQLSLPLDADSRDEDPLRAAWMRSGLPMPCHVALQNRPLAICLSCLADAMRKKTGKNRNGTVGACGSNLGRR